MSSSSQGKENGYAAQWGVTQRSASALMKPVSSVGLQRSSGDRSVPAGSHTDTPAITGRALHIPAVQPSCHHITQTLLNAERILVHSRWRVTDLRSTLRIISVEPLSNGESIIAPCRSVRAGLPPLRVHCSALWCFAGPANWPWCLLGASAPVSSLIEADTASWCWRPLLCAASPVSASGDQVSCNLRWGPNGRRPVEAALREEMTRWFEFAANPMLAPLPD